MLFYIYNQSSMDLSIYGLCVIFSEALMILFIMINYPYYKISYGEKAGRIVGRTILLNSLAIIIGWGPAVYFWPDFSQKFLLPAACILGALGCVASRFIYQEIIPKELAETIIQIIKNKEREK
jgi:hypothetical protein